MEKFSTVWDELDLKVRCYLDQLPEILTVLQTWIPQGGYFICVDMSRLRIPGEALAPSRLGELPLDCHICWFLTTVIGVSALPCSTFTSPAFKGLPEGFVRFSFGKSDVDLDIAMERLRKLCEYL